jgi:hopanoid-associated phosphorylase
MATVPMPASVLAACGLAFEAAIAAGPDVVTACGPGPERLAAQLEALLARGERDWAGIISFGCAGALDPGLLAGDCVLATGVQLEDGFMPVDAAWRHALQDCLPDALAGELLGLDAPLICPAGKAQVWRDSGACAVDMESHAAARLARRHGLPFAACRVVLDPAWRGVPSCALAGMRADGWVAPGPLLRALAAEPRELAPLLALALDAARARRVLRQVRGRLGPALAVPGRHRPA